jgi:hypothetical protein
VRALALILLGSCCQDSRFLGQIRQGCAQAPVDLVVSKSQMVVVLVFVSSLPQIHSPFFLSRARFVFQLSLRWQGLLFYVEFLSQRVLVSLVLPVSHEFSSA